MSSKSKFPDEPKSLKEDEVKQERMQLLDQAHIAPLTKFVEDLRTERIRGEAANFEREHIPYFDPLDGGVEAKCLFLFEAPGGKAVKSEFVSRNNPDQTAKTFFELNLEAGLDRCLTASWNIVPWYLGSGKKIRAAKQADIAQGFPHLLKLMSEMKNLQVIVLSGRKAQKAARNIRESRFSGQVVDYMWHPSPQSLNRVPSRREEILQVLHEIKRLVS